MSNTTCMGFYGSWNLILILFIWSEVNVTSKNQIKSHVVVKRGVLVVFDQCKKIMVVLDYRNRRPSYASKKRGVHSLSPPDLPEPSPELPTRDHQSKRKHSFWSSLRAKRQHPRYSLYKKQDVCRSIIQREWSEIMERSNRRTKISNWLTEL